MSRNTVCPQRILKSAIDTLDNFFSLSLTPTEREEITNTITELASLSKVLPHKVNTNGKTLEQPE